MSDTPPDIVYTRYDGRRGSAWLRDAYAMFRRRRIAWFVLLFTYYAVLLLIDLVPLVGGFAMPLLKPVFAVGFLAAAWTQERGGRPEVRLLFQGFRANLWALVALGAFFALGIMLAMGAAAAIDGGRLFDVLSNPAPQGMSQEDAAKRMQETFGNAQVQLGMLTAAACALPTLLAMWWAPALVVFQDATAVTALGMSLRAALANWRPLLRYALAVFFFGLVLPSFAGMIVALILPPPVGQVAILLLMLPYVFGLVATLHIADYVSYRDVFHSGETVAPDAAEPPSEVPRP